MKKENLINWKDIRKEVFSKDEMNKLDLEFNKKMVLREVEELEDECGVFELLQIANALDRDLEIRFVKRKK
jgi:hypothetical protein